MIIRLPCFINDCGNMLKLYWRFICCCSDPHNEINLSAGVVETFSVLVSHFIWISLGSSKLLLHYYCLASWLKLRRGSGLHGNVCGCTTRYSSATLAKVNKNGVPVALVITQLIITTIAIVVLTNTPVVGAICHFLLL